MSGKSRIVKDKETRIQEILQAGRQVFFEKGYQATTIDEVAQKAGVAKGTVYFYFGNKDDLYISLMLPTIKDLSRRMAAVEQELDRGKINDGPMLLRRFMDTCYGWARDDPDGFVITTTFQQGGLFSRMSDETLERINEEGRQGFLSTRSMILKGRARGFFEKDYNEVMLCDILWSTFLGVVQFEENRRRITGQDYIYETLKAAFDLMAQALCPDAPQPLQEGSP